MTAVITSLRDLVPIRPLTYAESMRIAELQATRLRILAGVTEAALAEKVISELPKVQVERMFPAPISGATQWSHGRWLIVLNGAEPLVRQRFSLAHEFKHILDNPFIELLYPATRTLGPRERAEQICDYFAGCLLMPRAVLKRAWVDGPQDLRKLARRFDVSVQAMQVRLLQVGLIEPSPRCEMAA
jgi:Zn-dependent peptidase ImmA (M78 family)